MGVSLGETPADPTFLEQVYGQGPSVHALQVRRRKEAVVVPWGPFPLYSHTCSRGAGLPEEDTPESHLQNKAQVRSRGSVHSPQAPLYPVPLRGGLSFGPLLAVVPGHLTELSLRWYPNRPAHTLHSPLEAQ